MKFYNPFKWHIVQDNLGNIYIRKWSFGWVFMDNKDNHTWRSPITVNKWCRFNSIQEAKCFIPDKFEVIH